MKAVRRELACGDITSNCARLRGFDKQVANHVAQVPFSVGYVLASMQHRRQVRVAPLKRNQSEGFEHGF